MAAHDILALKQAFSLSFNTIGDTPLHTTSVPTPPFPPVQHTWAEGAHQVAQPDWEDPGQVVTLGIIILVT